MKTMHHSIAARSVAPGRPEGASRRNPLPGVCAAAFALSMAAGPALANVECRPGAWTPDCMTQLAPARPAPSLTPPAETPPAETPTVTAVTASFHGLPDAHDGKKLFVFELRFSEEFAGLRLGMLKRTLEVTGGRLVDVKRTVRGKNRRMTVRVRPSSPGDVTVALPQVGWLWGPASATVAGPSAPPPAPSALTASFHGLPDEHNGKKLFSFEIRFSEEFSGLRLTALKEALEVTGGRVIDVKRTVRGENRRVTVRVRPASHEPVTVALGATTDCSAAGAICASDGRQLSGSLSASVTSPAWGGSGGTPYTLAALKSLNLHPPRAKAVVKTVSTGKPTGFPTSDPGTVVSMSHVGQLRERYDRGGHWVIDYPCIHPGADNVCRIGGGMQSDGTWGDKSGVDAYGRWFSYPHDAGTSDMKIHLLVRRATYDENGGDSMSGKLDLTNFFQRGHSVEYFFERLDFFTANAHLEAPGSAVQPTGTNTTTATWTGNVVGLDTAQYFDASKNPNFLRRGDVVGGTAKATVRFGNTVNNHWMTEFKLTNLRGANFGTSYPDLTWTFVQVPPSGNFQHDPDNPAATNSTGPGLLSGTFRGTGAAKVGGTFDVPPQYFQHGRYLGMVGGFIADKD